MNRTVALPFIVGIAVFIWSGFTYTKKVNIINVGPLQVNADKQQSVTWPPYLGGILVIAGVIILATAKKNT